VQYPKYGNELYALCNLAYFWQSLIAQLDRDQRIQELWAAAADMLDFLKDSAVAVDSIPASVVEAMMKQIYDCALFVREYAGIGFLSACITVLLRLGVVLIVMFNNIKSGLCGMA
jgi:hypothetical protein